MTEVMNNETVRRVYLGKGSSSDAAGSRPSIRSTERATSCIGVSLDMADRELCRGARAQRRRQDDAAAQHHRRQPADASDRSCSTAREIAQLEIAQARAWLGISYVPQGREIIPDITVAENIYLALLGKGERRKDVPSFVFDYFPASEGAGRAQRRHAVRRAAAAARHRPRALVQSRKLLLLDEPTEGLQPSVVEEIVSIIKRIPCGAKLRRPSRRAEPGFRPRHYPEIRHSGNGPDRRERQHRRTDAGSRAAASLGVRRETGDGARRFFLQASGAWRCNFQSAAARQWSTRAGRIALAACSRDGKFRTSGARRWHHSCMADDGAVRLPCRRERHLLVRAQATEYGTVPPMRQRRPA